MRYQGNNLCIIDSQKKSGIKGEEVYLKKSWLRTTLVWGEIWISEFTKLIEPPEKFSTQMLSYEGAYYHETV